MKFRSFFLCGLLTILPGIILADIDKTMPGPQRGTATNYVLKCIGCHMADGRGLPQAGIPDFVDSIGYFAGSPEGRAYLVGCRYSGAAELHH